MSFTQRDQIDDAKWDAIYNAIWKEADRILASEGPNTVLGTLFASADDATRERMHVAGERVKAKSKQLTQVEAMKAQARSHVKEMFEKSPFCIVCNERILTLEQATVFTPIGGKDRLLHEEDCLARMIEASIGRYLGRGRGKVVGGVR